MKTDVCIVLSPKECLDGFDLIKNYPFHDLDDSDEFVLIYDEFDEFDELIE